MARTKAPHFTLGRVDSHNMASVVLQTCVSKNIFSNLSDNMYDTEPPVNH